MISQRVTPLRVLLGALALGTLLTQVVIVPSTAAEYAEAYPEVAYLAAPYVTAIVVAIGGFEVALLAVWQLLSAAAAGGASPRRAKLLAHVLAVSLSFMAVIFAGVCVHAGSFAAVGGPAMLFGILASLALVLVAFVLRKKAVDFVLTDNVDGPLAQRGQYPFTPPHSEGRA
jgi:hypothetical protein